MISSQVLSDKNMQQYSLISDSIYCKQNCLLSLNGQAESQLPSLTTRVGSTQFAVAQLSCGELGESRDLLAL